MTKMKMDNNMNKLGTCLQYYCAIWVKLRCVYSSTCKLHPLRSTFHSLFTNWQQLSIEEIILIVAVMLFYHFRTGTRFSVRVSAVEIVGRSETVRDLLAEQATGTVNKLSMNDKRNTNSLPFADDDVDKAHLFPYSVFIQAQKMARVTQVQACFSVKTVMAELRYLFLVIQSLTLLKQQMPRLASLHCSTRRLPDSSCPITKRTGTPKSLTSMRIRHHVAQQLR